MDTSGRLHFLLLLIYSLCFFASTATPGTSPMSGRRGFDYSDTPPKNGVYSGKFLRGISTSKTGTQKYNDRFYSSVESVHSLEALDH
jgi:hypothetical protein